MPSACAQPNASPAMSTPRPVPTAGLISPIREADPAGILVSPWNQQT